MENDQTLQDVVTRIDALHARLERLERLESRNGASVMSPRTVSVLRPAPLRDQPQAIVQERSGQWLGMFGVGCFVLAVGYLVKIGIDAGWLTPIRQMILAYAFSGLLVMGGIRLKSADFLYASYLPGAGFAGLFLTTIASVLTFQVLSAEMGSTLLLLLSWACIAIGSQFHPFAFLVVATLGAYAGPMWFFTEGSAFLVPFYCVASLSFSTLALMREERSLNLLSAYGALLATTQAASAVPEESLFAIVAVMVVFVIHLIGIFLHTRRTGRGLTEPEAYAYIPWILFTYALEYVPFSKSYPDAWVIFGMTFSAAIVVGQWISGRFLNLSKNSPSHDVAYSSALLIFTHAVILKWLPAEFHHTLGLALILVAALVPERTLGLTDQLRVFGWVTRILAVFLVLTSYITIFGLALRHESSTDCIQALLFGAGTVVAFLRRKSWMLNFGRFGIAAGHLMTLVGLYAGFAHFGALAVSVTWVFYAFVCLGMGFWLKHREFARLSMLTLGAIGAKVLFYDLWNTSALIRVSILLVSGAALYGGGFIYRR
ncbi:MAG: DUF2339 domain-containing protein, partial [Proteobacteria bacterium]